MPEFENILYEVEGPVLTITLNRPEALNALSPDLERELHEALNYAKTDDAVRSIIITGAGRAFSSGYDISGDSSSRSRLPTSGHLKRWWDSAMRNPDMIMNVMGHPKPIIAAINGWCIGGGFWYSLACDVTIAAENATFGQPEVRMTSNTTVLFAILCGWKNAHRYALTGDHFDAAEALRIGAVNEVVPADRLMERARQLATRLAQVPAESVRLNKAITTYGLDAMGLRAALNMNGVLSSIVEASNDGPDVAHLEKARAEGGFGSFLKARDDPFRPEPFGPRS
ncbi:MAG: enoyl-CoA hydratase/isomerase family protein [Dehalococcoidia bacterium]